MAVSFGFSVGDIIAGINLIITGIRSVRVVGGSSAQYQALSLQLESLKAGLTAVDSLKLAFTAQAEYKAISEATRRCQLCVETFVATIAKYQHWLQLSKQGWKANLRGVQWAFCKRKDIEDFRDQLSQHTSSISKLGLGQVKSHMVNESTYEIAKELRAGASRSCGLIQKLSILQAGFFEHLKLCNEQLVEQVSWLKNSNEDLHAKVGGLQNLLQLQQSIPPQVLLQRPVQFLDACGRVTAFHLDFIDCVGALLAVLKIRFRQNGVTEKGMQKLDKFEFVLRDRSEELSLQEPWQVVLKPGQSVYMSMVFRQPGFSSQCPGCGFEYPVARSIDIDCIRSVLDLRKDNLAILEVYKLSIFDKSVNGRTSIAQAGSSKQSSDKEWSTSGDELNEFRRVQIDRSEVPFPGPYRLEYLQAYLVDYFKATVV
ncbi:hypothetical protein MMC17_009063 [Xylographa soralifera]|nr:hypothetical protein [Xylographa soralifera]